MTDLLVQYAVATHLQHAVVVQDDQGTHDYGSHEGEPNEARHELTFRHMTIGSRVS